MSTYEPSRRPPPSTSSYDPRNEHRRRREHRDRRDHIPRSSRYTPSDYSQSEAYNQRPPPAGSEISHHTATEPPAAEEQYQLAPYDDEKAYAEYSRVYGPPSPEPTYAPPPRQRRRNSYDDGRPPYRQGRGRDADDRSDDLMSYDRRRPRDDVSLYAASTSYDGRDSRYDERYDIPPPKEPKADGKSGLKSSLIGGASGAYLGNRFVGKGALGTLGGAVAGAIGVNAMEHFDGKRQRKKEEKDKRRRVDTIADEAMAVEPRGKSYRRDYYPEYDTPARSRYTDRGLPRGPYEARHRRRSRPRYRSLSADEYGRRY